MKTISEVLTERINEWDPIDLMDIAPKDEYQGEVMAIMDKLGVGMSVEDIATVIRDVMVEKFGELLPACQSEVQTKRKPKPRDGEFSKRCFDLAKTLHHYL